MPTLLVLLKYPSPGQVKTRLAESIGADRAAALYRDWVGRVLETVQPLRKQFRVVGYFDGALCSNFQSWELMADQWWPQPAGDLGDKLEAGFTRAFLDDQLVVAIGTDCLDLDAALIRQAFVLLESHDVVFGPTLDGGYYLVGTGRNCPSFFAGVSWSSHDTLQSHRAVCQQNAWTVATLPTLRDIDTWDDWQAHCRERGEYK
jgi:rSAM/selenodomain-associated transferase 1